MTYLRVIPRDLFNEANLLKCYGQLYLELEKLRLEDCLIHTQSWSPFDTWQNQDDGSISIGNVRLQVRGETVRLYRPLNSRDPYPLYADTGEDTLSVFEDSGKLSQEFHAFLTAR